MARLLLLNGAPGAGKTTLARRHLVDHPLALLLDIDDLRTHLGQWDRLDESRAIARELALVLAEAHLMSGRDVVVPQYVGRDEFIERLDALARRCGAEFVEVVLAVEPTVAVERFRRRRHELESSAAPHPEADVADADVALVVAEALDRLAGICAGRPTTRRVPATTDVTTTYDLLLAAIDAGACAHRSSVMVNDADRAQ